MKINKSSGFILVLSALLLTALFFYPIIFNLNKVLFTEGGDGIKNYFTYLYYLSYDSGIHFSGMNYPFGENVIFTDNTPLLAWSIKILNVIFPGIHHYGLGIMHFMLLPKIRTII